MAKKRSKLSQREKLKKARGKDIYKITTEMHSELKQLAAMPDDEINLADPDVPKDIDWSNAQMGKFYRPVKKQITIRIDADVLDWFQHQPGRYQSLINEICRTYMKQHTNQH